MTSENSYRRSAVDKFFLRAKDVMLLFTSCIPMVILVSKFWMLPGLVEAHAKQLTEVQAKLTAEDKEIAVLQQGINDIKYILLQKKEILQ